MPCANVKCKYKRCRYHINNDYRPVGYARTVRVMEDGELCKEEKKRLNCKHLVDS